MTSWQWGWNMGIVEAAKACETPSSNKYSPLDTLPLPIASGSTDPKIHKNWGKKVIEQFNDRVNWLMERRLHENSGKYKIEDNEKVRIGVVHLVPLNMNTRPMNKCNKRMDTRRIERRTYTWIPCYMIYGTRINDPTSRSRWRCRTNVVEEEEVEEGVDDSSSVITT